jgi:predicted permease
MDAVALRSAIVTARQTLRSRRELPGIVVALALGVGLTVAVYSVLHAVLLTPPPYAAPERLVQVWTAPAEGTDQRLLSEVDQAALSAPPSPFHAIASFGIVRHSLQPRADSTPLDVRGAAVSVTLFDVLGVRPADGRVFDGGDDQLAGPQAVILSERLVRSTAFRAGPGDMVLLDGVSHRVVGVMPEAFWFPDRHTTYWVPLPSLLPSTDGPPSAVVRSFSAIARLREGVSAEAAQSQAAARVVSRRGVAGAEAVRVEAYTDALAAPLRPSLYVLQGASLALLVLVSLNVGWLFAARAQRLRPAFQTMTSLGATRAQIGLSQIVSAACIAVVAVPGALLTAWVVLGFGLTLESGVLAKADLPAITGHVVIVTCLVTFAVCLSSSLPGAWLSAASGNGIDGHDRTVTRRWLAADRPMMAAQVALVFAASAQALLVSLVLLSLSRTNVGLPRSDYLVVSLVARPGTGATAPLQLPAYLALLARLSDRGIPTAAANIFPLTTADYTRTFERRRSREHRRAQVRTRIVTPSYFALTGVAPVRGRLLTDADAGTRAVLVTDAYLRAVPHARQGRDERTGEAGEYTIAGVVAETRQYAILEAATPEVYVLFDDFLALHPDMAPSVLSRVYLLARPAHGVAATEGIIRQEVAALLPTVEVRSVSLAADLIAASLGANRLVAAGSVLFAGVALLLAAAGLYAMISHRIESGSREIGVRRALGATTGQILVVVARPMATAYGIGVCLGVVLLLVALASVRSIVVPPPGGSYPSVPIIVMIAAVTLLTVLAAACYRPVRRAVRIDAAVCLRRH